MRLPLQSQCSLRRIFCALLDPQMFCACTFVRAFCRPRSRFKLASAALWLFLVSLNQVGSMASLLWHEDRLFTLSQSFCAKYSLVPVALLVPACWVPSLSTHMGVEVLGLNPLAWPSLCARPSCPYSARPLCSALWRPPLVSLPCLFRPLPGTSRCPVGGSPAGHLITMSSAGSTFV